MELVTGEPFRFDFDIASFAVAVFGALILLALFGRRF
jgi:hypothetical protein